ncbi:hypothetical protein Nps_02010 [Candidatus Nanopusillus acidilobi]|nr:hypothetical protein Nps_02010 [Candidatus Nanopusillus acidilobi]
MNNIGCDPGANLVYTKNSCTACDDVLTFIPSTLTISTVVPDVCTVCCAAAAACPCALVVAPIITNAAIAAVNAAAINNTIAEKPDPP